MKRFLIHYLLTMLALVVSVLALAVALATRAGAAEYTHISDVGVGCYYIRSVTNDCEDLRSEAEDYLAKRHWVCADVIYITLEGSRERVRCRGFDNSIIDYVSQPDGNFKLLR